MYDVIYNQFLETGVARKIESSVYLDRSGNIVQKDLKFGEACDIEIIHPDYILFGDETGCNTSQKKDGHEAGTKFVVGKGQVPRTSCVTTDHRFTLLPITAANGEPVICVIIFQGKSSEVPASWASGIDILLEPTRGADGKISIDDCNFGQNKYFPGGPICNFRGKQIPCATYVTEGGGISGEILVDVLRILDALEVFPRVAGGPIPFLIINGHESQLDPKFLMYINDEDHIWKVCLGVPYATNYWQVGDSSEQNGTFKVLWYREKKVLVTYKRCRGMPLCLVPKTLSLHSTGFGITPMGESKSTSKLLQTGAGPLPTVSFCPTQISNPTTKHRSSPNPSRPSQLLAHRHWIQPT